jgi:Tfp pilus assembly protein PilF
MLKVDLGLTQIPATREGVLSLHESINMPLVSIPNIGTAPTQAFVLGLRNDTGSYSVVVVLRQADNDANLVYVSDPRTLTAEQYRFEEGEGLRFVESMGFLMNDHGYRALAPERQRELIERTPIFVGARERTVDLVDVDAAPPSFEPDAIFGGLENVPMLKGEPESPPTFSPSARASAPTQRPTVPAPGPGPTLGFGSTPPRSTPSTLRPGPPPPAPAAPAVPAVDPEALGRLGRFLSTFCAVLALSGGQGCAHQPAADAESLSAATQTQYDIAEHFLARGQWSEAVGAFQPVLEDAPRYAPARHGLGLAYMYLERPDLAEAAFKAAIELDPSYSTARNSLATLYMQGSRCEEAAALLAQVLEDIMYPTPEFAQDNLARVEHCLGKSKAALARLEKLVISKPQFCRAYLTMADIAAAVRAPEVAIRACDDFTNRCELHEQIGKLVSPENRSLCYLRKGMAHAALGDVESARQTLEKCDSTGTFGKQCKDSLRLLTGDSWGAASED